MPSALSLHPSSTALPDTRSLCSEIGSIARGLIRDLFDTYRPEQHYMRGPGPKWRKTHQGAPAIQRSALARVASVPSA